MRGLLSGASRRGHLLAPEADSDAGDRQMTLPPVQSSMQTLPPTPHPTLLRECGAVPKCICGIWAEVGVLVRWLASGGERKAALRTCEPCM